jgi:hypothetical protein
MRTVLFTLLLAGCTTNDHAIYGQYLTHCCGDGVDLDGGGGTVVEVTASDSRGDLLDDGYFHDETVEGSWTVHVPDGAVSVVLDFKEYTSDGNDHYLEAVADGPVTDDVDAGLIVISR